MMVYSRIVLSIYCYRQSISPAEAKCTGLNLNVSYLYSDDQGFSTFACTKDLFS